MRLSHSHSQILTIIIILSALLPGLFLFGDSEYVTNSFSYSSFIPSPLATSTKSPGAGLPKIATTTTLKFLFFGDLMLDRHVGEKLAGKNIDYLLGDLDREGNRIWSDLDLVGANLEGAVTDGGAHYSPAMAYDFAFTPERINELKQYGFNFFNLANNHISDQGDKGLRETRNNLHKLEFNFSGDVDAAVSQESLKIISIKEKKIAMLGLSMVYHNFDLEEAKKLVDEAKKGSDLVIINIHWGTEYQHQFSRQQQSIGRALIDSGADIIIGHHPHVVQGMEIYQGKPIFYSLGNFIFDQYFSADTQQGLAVSLNIGDDKTSVFLFPLQSKSAAVSLMGEGEKTKFLEKYAEWSAADDALKIAILEQKIEISGGLGK